MVAATATNVAVSATNGRGNRNKCHGCRDSVSVTATNGHGNRDHLSRLPRRCRGNRDICRGYRDHCKSLFRQSKLLLCTAKSHSLFSQSLFVHLGRWTCSGFIYGPILGPILSPCFPLWAALFSLCRLPFLSLCGLPYLVPYRAPSGALYRALFWAPCSFCGLPYFPFSCCPFFPLWAALFRAL